MKKTSLWLCGLALLLILCSSLSGAQAYFTTNIWASGGRPIRLGSVSEIHEDFSSWTKRVTIKAEDDSEPVFVRARAYADETVSLMIFDEKDNWTDGGDGWFYYGPILYAGESTTELLMKISGLPADAQPGTDFNVVVIYETTRVLYQPDGTPYADWGSEEGGN